MDIEASIPAALTAVHNFIRSHEADDEDFVWVGGDDPRTAGAGGEEEEQYPQWDDEAPSTRRDNIASGMWAEYQAELANWAAAVGE